VIVMAVPVIVRIAVRAAPVFGATENWTVPFPAPAAVASLMPAARASRVDVVQALRTE
jgi:hypothetical protein